MKGGERVPCDRANKTFYETKWKIIMIDENKILNQMILVPNKYVTANEMKQCTQIHKKTHTKICKPDYN